MSPCGKLTILTLALVLAVRNTSAQGWAAGDSPVIGSGSTVTVSTAQPNLVRFTDNGTLTFVAGGSVTVTGAVSSLVGSGVGMSGTLSLSGGSMTKQSSFLAIGYLGGTGSLSIASGSTLNMQGSSLRIASNEDGQRDLPSYGEVTVSGSLLANAIEFSSFFPTNLTPPYVEVGRFTLNEGGLAETDHLQKNDCVNSTFLFNGGTLRAKQNSSDFVIGRGVLALVIADGKNAVIDTNGKNITINPQANPYATVLTLSGETNAASACNGGLKKTGLGALVFRLSATENTFTGAIEVVQGTLDLGRALAANQTVLVHSGATFVMNSVSETNRVTVLNAPADRMLYVVGANTDSLNLSALSGSFYDDRLGSPLSGTTTLSGLLTHSAAVGTVGAPFRLLGQGGTLNLTNTMLETKALQVEGSGTFTFMGSRTHTAADAGKLVITDGGYRQDQTLAVADSNVSTPAALAFASGRLTAGNALDVGVNGFGAFAAHGVQLSAGTLRVGGGTGFAGGFVQSTGTVTLSSESYVGLNGGTGELTVTGGQFIVNNNFRIASNPSVNTSLRPQASVTVSNALLRCSDFYFTSWWPSDGSVKTVEAGLLTLLPGGIAEVNSIHKNDDPISRVVFNGGLLRARAASSSFLFSDQTFGTLRVLTEAGQFAAIDTQGYAVTVAKQTGALTVTGLGGLKKLGSGTLTFSASQVAYAGDTVIEAGILLLGDNNQIPHGPGTGDVRIASSAIFDLNGKNETVNRLIGLGLVRSTNNAPATLGVLANGADDTWERAWLNGPITLDKRGSGTLTLAAANAAPTNLTVSAGTVRLTSATGYPFYRFKVEGVKNPITANAMQFSELKLYNGGVDVTTNRIGILYDSTGGIGALPEVSAFPPNEMPEKAVDNIMLVGTTTGNKWLDFRAKSTRTAADRDRVWLRIDFPNAQKITSYNWATGNDATDRDPSFFRLQGSYNGADWSDIDVQSNYTATATRNAWVSSGAGFAVASAGTPNVINDGANVTVQAGATLLLDGISETVSGLAGYGSVTLSNANLTLTGSTNATMLFGGTLAGNGALIKTGAGTQNICGTNAFTGDLVVQGGTLAVQGGTPSTWFRYTIQKNKGETNVTQLSEFALYSADGTRRNVGLTQGSGTNSLLQGQFATPAAYTIGSVAESPDTLFDSATGTKWCLTANTPMPGSPSTYRVVVMRLTNNTPEITSYNLCTANDVPERDPVNWTLESSSDGVNWITVDARTDVAPPTGVLPIGRFTWYNSGAAYTLAARAIVDGDTDSIPDTSVVEIRSGATLSVSNGSDVIGALRVDMVSAGTLTRLTAKPNGALYLVNASGRPASWAIPLAITTVTNPSELKTWKVYANGVEVRGYTLVYDAATGKFRLNAQGTLIRLL